MLNETRVKIVNNTIAFVLVSVLLGGILYAVKTSYKANNEVDSVKKSLDKYSSKLEVVTEQLASIQLNNGTLTEKKLKELIGKIELIEREKHASFIKQKNINEEFNKVMSILESTVIKKKELPGIVELITEEMYASIGGQKI